MRKLISWASVPLLALALTACSGSPSKSPSDSEAPPEISVGASSFAGFAAVLSLADDEDAVVDVEVVEFGSSAQRGVALVNGDIDMALLGWTQVAELKSRQGADIVVIASNFERGRTLIARADSGIEGVEDLQGQTVAYSAGSMVDLDINSQLESAGMSLSDVDAVNMSFSDMVIALANGDIDAFYGSEPQSSRTVTSGSGYLVQYPYDGLDAVPYGAINGALVVTREYLEENEEDVLAFLRAYVEETDALNADPDRLAALVSDMVGESDEEIINLTLDNLALTYSLDGYEEQFAALIDTQLKLGFIDDAPEYAQVVDPSYLQEVLK